jgi:hypothetical protein
MSLQLVAQHLAQKGRGPDSTLVHMSNKEVAGLQALAQKHGGQLGVNPSTGLPEAGFLDSILPAVAGAGISYFSGGTIDPLTAAGIVGGVTALDSKDLSKGLMAGLGAYGGAGMVGGLAGLGAAGADTAAMAAPEYQAAVGTGAGNFVDAPMASLKTLGGGSVLKGSLPILAGLAPAAADMLGEEDTETPTQKKGYIRKYALDPVTGQYKQVGVYEAGGDPNKDVSSEAGTAGAFGAVGQSEYQKAHGMASGGTATDSQRVYDYLMGRGENPMQFTHTAAPQVDYSSYMPKPITPTTPILDQQYDQYGNVINRTSGGGGQTQEQRDEQNKQLISDYGIDPTTGSTYTREGYWNSPKEVRDAIDAKFAEEHPIKNAFAEGFKTFVMPGGILGKIANTVKLPFGGGIPVTDPRNFADIPGNEGLVKTAADFNGNFYSPSLGGPEAGRTAPMPSSAVSEGNAGEAAAAQNMREAAAAQAEGERSTGETNERSFGNADARGGYLQHGQFDQRMAHGGISGHLRPPQPFYEGGKFSYKGPQVYADGGGIADLHQYNLGSYSDGGRLLKGPGDGVSDDIPATIGHGQPARLADGEFVIPARIVSEIGNGSTDAGARELYKMMDRIQAGRAKTVGKDQVATNSKAVRHLPA